jgi:undecaprenyl-phosphate 4-deoxy-4-formamido-L-arabinose transferase
MTHTESNRKTNIKVSLIIPVYNESENLQTLMERVRPAMESLEEPYEIILVDDGSRDRSLEILKTFTVLPEVQVVELTRNYGQHAAVFAGFSVASGEICVTMDADLQNPPEEIPRLVRTMVEGGFEVVGTVRREREDSLFRKIASKIINKVARRITKVNMSDWGCMLRAYHRNVVERLLTCREQATFIPALAVYFAKNIIEIEVAHEARYAGTTKYSLRKLINLQFDLVSSFSDFPLKLIMYAGLLMAFFGVAFGTLLGVARIAYGASWAAEGVFTLFAVLFAFVGMQFFALGVMGEYIGRIYREVRRRPEFVIEKIHTSRPEGKAP